MLKLKIVKKEHYNALITKNMELKGEVATLRGENKVLQDMIKQGEEDIEKLKEAHIHTIEELRKEYEKEIEKEKDKMSVYLGKQKQKNMSAKQKWLHAFPDEDYKG